MHFYLGFEVTHGVDLGSGSPTQRPRSLSLIQNLKARDFPRGPVAQTPHSQYRGAQRQSLVRELDPTCCN